MSKIRAKDTKPEIRVRNALNSLGFKHTLHAQNLPGKPDIVFANSKIAIQVRGCFWHGHTCIDGHTPKSRKGYWNNKLKDNMFRDRRNDRRLRKLGWKILRVWECDCMSRVKLLSTMKRIILFLE